MFIVIVKSDVKKECVEEYTRLALELKKGSLSEDGCVKFDILQDINDDSKSTFVEYWKDKDCLKSHCDSVHYKTIVPKLNAMRLSKDIYEHTNIE